MRALVISLLTLLLWSAPEAFSADLGGGIRCEGRTLRLGSRRISLSKARTRINDKIVVVRRRIAILKKQKNRVAQLTSARASLVALQTTRSRLFACTSGKIAAQEQLVRTFVQTNAGTYRGLYQDSVLSVTGSMAVVVGMDGDFIEGELSYDGMYGFLFGGDSLRFRESVSGLTLPLSIKSATTAFGDLTVTIGADGAFSVVGTNAPAILSGGSSALSCAGAIGQGAISGSYSFSQVGQAPILEGNFTLARE